ncbi:hypothetical protein [Helicobacter aurati]|uniref:hypothetical protein n=1 Tax=Helicobacter aurati TaxID=137778 RepID=UPI0011C0843C|nr:hypothetical protein [Helicobacter aurati]
MLHIFYHVDSPHCYMVCCLYRVEFVKQMKHLFRFFIPVILNECEVSLLESLRDYIVRFFSRALHSFRMTNINLVMLGVSETSLRICILGFLGFSLRHDK